MALWVKVVLLENLICPSSKDQCLDKSWSKKKTTDTPCVFFLDWKEMVSVGCFLFNTLENPMSFSFFEFEKSEHFLDVANGLFFGFTDCSPMIFVVLGTLKKT